MPECRGYPNSSRSQPRSWGDDMMPELPVASPAPAAPRAERLDHLDALRGFALCGISAINVTVFADPGGMPSLRADQGPADHIVTTIQFWLIESKFFTLFSFLFGIGFALQRTGRTGGTGRYLRRLAALAVFGILHVALLWEGDILLMYAVVGLLLLAYRDCQPRTLVWWAVGLLAVPLVFYFLAAVVLALVEASTQGSEALRKAEAKIMTDLDVQRANALIRYTTGDFGIRAVDRLVNYAGLVVLLVTRVPTVLAMFLLGLAAARTGVATRPAEHLPLLRRVRFWCLGLGLPLAGLVAAGFLFFPLIPALMAFFFSQALAGPVLALGYAAAFTLFALRPGVGRWLSPLTALGRMGLTNYLSVSLVLCFIFSGFGLGLAGRLPPAAAAAVSLATVVGLAAISMAWLRWFQFGPMEWVWRTITYARIQPLRRRLLDSPLPASEHGQA